MKRLILLIVIGWLSIPAVFAQQAEMATAFELAAADGQLLALPEEQDGIGIYLFWASWCPYCRALMPHLQSIEDEYGDRVTVYALNFRDEGDARGYMAERGFEFVLLPEADAVAESWGVFGTPGLFVVDSAGRVRFNLYDVVTEDPPGWSELKHGQRAERRAPFWAARVRAALDDVLSGS